MLNKLISRLYKGYSIKLNLIGVGYKAFLENNKLSLKIGYSHHIYYEIPKDVIIKILNQKLLTLAIFGIDFQQITQVAAEIRFLKPVEPYKGKGIKYFNEPAFCPLRILVKISLRQSFIFYQLAFFTPIKRSSTAYFLKNQRDILKVR